MHCATTDNECIGKPAVLNAGACCVSLADTFLEGMCQEPSSAEASSKYSASTSDSLPHKWYLPPPWTAFYNSLKTPPSLEESQAVRERLHRLLFRFVRSLASIRIHQKLLGFYQLVNTRISHSLSSWDTSKTTFLISVQTWFCLGERYSCKRFFEF